MQNWTDYQNTRIKEGELVQSGFHLGGYCMWIMSSNKEVIPVEFTQPSGLEQLTQGEQTGLSVDIAAHD